MKQRGSAWTWCQVPVRAELFTFAHPMFHGKSIVWELVTYSFSAIPGLPLFQLIGRFFVMFDTFLVYFLRSKRRHSSLGTARPRYQAFGAAAPVLELIRAVRIRQPDGGLDDAQGAWTVHSFSERPTWDSAHREPEEAAGK